MSAPEPMPHDAVKRALGAELRRARETLGWTRADLAERLPTKTQDHVLYTYEQGIRNCTVARFVEICRPLGVDPPEILGLALQRAKFELDTQGLIVDLHAVVDDGDDRYRAVRDWAHTRLMSEPTSNGVVRLSNAVLREISIIFGCTRAGLVDYLTKFAPTN